MVERSLSMREVPGSIPGASISFTLQSKKFKYLLILYVQYSTADVYCITKSHKQTVRNSKAVWIKTTKIYVA